MLRVSSNLLLKAGALVIRTTPGRHAAFRQHNTYHGRRVKRYCTRLALNRCYACPEMVKERCARTGERPEVTNGRKIMLDRQSGRVIYCNAIYVVCSWSALTTWAPTPRLTASSSPRRKCRPTTPASSRCSADAYANCESDAVCRESCLPVSRRLRTAVWAISTPATVPPPAFCGGGSQPRSASR